MEVKDSIHTIQITANEAYDIACDIKNAFIQTMQTHWVNHPNAWKENEKERTKRMKLFFELGNYPSHYNYAIDEAVKIIEESKKEKSKVKP